MQANAEVNTQACETRMSIGAATATQGATRVSSGEESKRDSKRTETRDAKKIDTREQLRIGNNGGNAEESSTPLITGASTVPINPHVVDEEKTEINCLVSAITQSDCGDKKYTLKEYFYSTKQKLHEATHKQNAIELDSIKK